MQFLQVLFVGILLCCRYKIISARHGYLDRWVVDDHGCLLPDNEAGFCTNLATCETVLYLIGNHDYNSAEAREILKRYACGVDASRGTKVCCPYTPLNVETSPTLPDHSNHQNLRLLPEDCGSVRAWGLFNGNEANLFEFGWSVLLKYQKDGDPYICGGSLISEKYILTSASCIRNKYKLIGARIGEQDTKTLQDCTWEYSAGNRVENCGPAPQDFIINEKDAVVHPNYESGTFKNNIALIRLRQKLDITVESVCTICLPINIDEKIEENKKYTAIGWGITERGLDSSVLLKMLTEKIHTSGCTETYRGIGEISAKQLCVRGVQNEDLCVEDYGGPLMGYYSKGNVYKTIQYGIVSTRSSRCSFPTVYTNTVPYVGWILDNLKP